MRRRSLLSAIVGASALCVVVWSLLDFSPSAVSPAKLPEKAEETPRPRPIFPPLPARPTDAPESLADAAAPTDLPSYQREIEPPPLRHTPKFQRDLEARLGFQVAIAAPAGSVGLATVGVFLPDGTPLGHRKYGGMRFGDSDGFSAAEGELVWEVRDFVLDLDETRRAGGHLEGPPWWITVEFEGRGGEIVRRTGAAPLETTEEWWGAPVAMVEVMTEDFDQRPALSITTTPREGNVDLLRRGIWGPIEVAQIPWSEDPRIPELAFLPSVLVRLPGSSKLLGWDELLRGSIDATALDELSFLPVGPRNPFRDRRPPTLKTRPAFDGILKREVGLQIAMAAPSAFEGSATICLALDDGTPLYCEQRPGISFERDGRGGRSETTLHWQVIDVAFDLAQTAVPEGTDEWIVTVDLLGQVGSETVLRTGMGRLETSRSRLLDDPPLVEVPTEDSRNGPMKEISIRGEDAGYRISRQAPNGPAHLLVVFEGEATIPELAFSETEVVRFFAEGELPQEIQFDELESGETLTLEEGAVIVARPMTDQPLPTGLTLSAISGGDSYGGMPIRSGTPLRLRPVPPGEVTISLRLRRAELWSEVIEVEAGEVDISARLPDLFSLIRTVEILVNWPPGTEDPRTWARIESANPDDAIALVNLGAEGSALFLVPINEASVRTLTWIAPEPGFEPVEVDLSQDRIDITPTPRHRP